MQHIANDSRAYLNVCFDDGYGPKQELALLGIHIEPSEIGESFAISTGILQVNLQIDPVVCSHSEFMAGRALLHYVTILVTKILDAIIG